MKVALSAAVLASLVAPAFSLSYLESLNKANPVAMAPEGGSVSNGASYLDALASPGSSAPSGAGMSSYLDSLPKNAAPSTGGAGMASYADALGGGPGTAASSPATSAPEPEAPAAAEPSSFSSEPAPAVSSSNGSYLDALSASSTNKAPSGPGLTGYLDALPRAASTPSGAGIQTYKDSLPVTNTVAGSGSGLNTYTDNLSGGKYTSSSKSFTPFGASPKAPSFVGSVGGSEIGFTLEASDLSSLVEQLRGSGGTIRLSGSIEDISFT